jgi:hypothetical protein
MKISSVFYRIARLINDLETLGSLDGKKISKRIQNKWIGRNIIRKIWRR